MKGGMRWEVRSTRCLLGAGCWMLGAGCWELEVGSWVPEVGNEKSTNWEVRGTKL